jgi:hypothetical protein
MFEDYQRPINMERDDLRIGKSDNRGRIQD